MVRVLCLGDSLTSGVTSRGEWPYSRVLVKRLGAGNDVIDAGLGGDFAVDMPERLRKLLTVAAAKYRGRIDVVVVLGGTNDLRAGKGAEEIAEALKDCADAARSHSALTILCTVPEMRIEATAGRGQSIRERRLALNALLQEIASTRSGTSLVDLASRCCMLTLSEEERVELWADDVHPTAKGYRLMGGHIADALLPLLPNRSRCASNVRRRVAANAPRVQRSLSAPARDAGPGAALRG